MDRKLILDFDRKEKSRKHKSQPGSKHNQSPHKKPKKDEPSRRSEAEEPSTSYRDRAQERREGINRDFELDPDDLIISNPTVDGEHLIDEAKRRQDQIEESKYLGGDVEHTHLVKGLDFALLEKEKIKASHEKEDSEKQRRGTHFGEDLLLDASDSEEEELTKEALFAASSTSANKRQIDISKLRASDIVPCRTAIARRILNALDDKWPRKSELFLPGRMSYVVPIDADSDSQVTTILRSKAEQQEQEPASEKDLVIEQLINIFAKIRRTQTSQ